jgi:hypothetical protein
MFLNSENQEDNSHQEKILEDNIITKVRDYFTENSNIWYTYKFNEKTGDVEYSYPRTFSKDIINLKNYFTKLFNRN